MENHRKLQMFKKKWKKDDFLIIVLMGILLCVIVWPTSNKSFLQDNKNSILSNRKQNKCSNNTFRDDTMLQVENCTEQSDDDILTYEKEWENRLQQCLSGVEGVGTTRVLISVRESEAYVSEKVSEQKEAKTDEKDAEGGTRSMEEHSVDEQIVYTKNSEGREVPFFTKKISPVVEGVAVVAEGADDFLVRQNIINVIEVLFGIDSNKITVVKMKSIR